MKAEALLNLTWGLYHHNIFHNTQLNDLIRKSTVDAAQWDFRKGSRVKAAKAISWTQIEKMFAVYEAKYGNYLSEMVELTVTNKRYLARFSADSIRVVTMDEKSFGSFNYPLKVYSPSKGIIRIRYSTGKGVDRKRAEEELSVVALEKGGKLLQKHSIISNNDTAWVEFSIPHEGDYTLQLAQFHATPVDWVIFPTGNLVYIEKKQLIHHGIRLMEEKGSAYSNRQLAVWNNFKPFAFQPLFENVRNTVSFHSSEGHPLATSLHTSRNQFQVVPTKTLQPFSFYRNDVMRWPVVLQNLPPYFFFLGNKMN